MPKNLKNTDHQPVDKEQINDEQTYTSFKDPEVKNKKSKFDNVKKGFDRIKGAAGGLKQRVTERLAKNSLAQNQANNDTDYESIGIDEAYAFFRDFEAKNKKSKFDNVKKGFDRIKGAAGGLKQRVTERLAKNSLAQNQANNDTDHQSVDKKQINDEQTYTSFKDPEVKNKKSKFDNVKKGFDRIKGAAGGLKQRVTERLTDVFAKNDNSYLRSNDAHSRSENNYVDMPLTRNIANPSRIRESELLQDTPKLIANKRDINDNSRDNRNATVSSEGDFMYAYPKNDRSKDFKKDVSNESSREGLFLEDNAPISEGFARNSDRYYSNVSSDYLQHTMPSHTKDGVQDGFASKFSSGAKFSSNEDSVRKKEYVKKIVDRLNKNSFREEFNDKKNNSDRGSSR